MHRLPEPLRAQVLDFAEHSSPEQAVRLLQTILDVDPDGSLSERDLRALGQLDLKTVNNCYAAMRSDYYYALVHADASLQPELKNWIKRAERFLWT